MFYDFTVDFSDGKELDQCVCWIVIYPWPSFNYYYLSTMLGPSICLHHFILCFNMLKQIPLIVSLQKYVWLANLILKNTLKLPQYSEPDKSNNSLISSHMFLFDFPQLSKVRFNFYWCVLRFCLHVCLLTICVPDAQEHHSGTRVTVVVSCMGVLELKP